MQSVACDWASEVLKQINSSHVFNPKMSTQQACHVHLKRSFRQRFPEARHLWSAAENCVQTSMFCLCWGWREAVQIDRIHSELTMTTSSHFVMIKISPIFILISPGLINNLMCFMQIPVPLSSASRSSPYWDHFAGASVPQWGQRWRYQQRRHKRWTAPDFSRDRSWVSSWHLHSDSQGNKSQRSTLLTFLLDQIVYWDS